MATAVQKIILSSSRDIPFNKLVLSQSNVRRVKAGISIEDLAASIARRDLIQSLSIFPVVDAEGVETGMFEVPAGGRRFRALELLVKQKRLAKVAPVPCVVRDRDGAILPQEVSLAENIERAPLNTGVGPFAMLGHVSEELFDQTFGLNVRAMLFAAQGAIDLMTMGGAIVLVGSIADVVGTKGYSVYGASKAAVRSFARTWANELASRGIRVNIVSPGPTDTAMFEKASDELRRAVTGLIPLGRPGKPDEVASAALFLASEENSFTTGAELCVDGGAAQV